MKVALVHDYLNQFGGGERVLEVLLAMFPQADLYTLLYDPERTYGRFSGRRVMTSAFDKPLVRRHHRPFIPLMPFALQTLRLADGYDLVISDSAGFAKGIACPRNAFHLSYCHTPLRYAWERKTYFANFFFRHLAAPAFAALRAWDRQAALKPDALVANSRYVAEKVKQYYRREADVVYPPVDTERFSYDAKVKPGDYYLAVGRLLPYKKFDLVLKAFAGLKLPLLIAGAGPELERLERMSRQLNVNAEFRGFVRDDRGLRDLYRRARALLFPQVEDFGLVAVEAIACGTPVIAYAAGGALEIVEQGKSGLFFREQTPESLREAVFTFDRMAFNRRQVAARAARFSVAAFERGIRAHLPKRLRPVAPPQRGSTGLRPRK